MAARKTKKRAQRKPARKKLRASAKARTAAKKSTARASRGMAVRRGKSSRTRGKPAKKLGRVVLNGHHLSPPACKVGLALTLMGVPFEYRHIDLGTGAGKTPEYLAKNRAGQVPVLEHNGMAIAQSNVILQYLADTFGKFGGRTPQEKVRIAEWLMWDQDFMHSGVGWPRGFTRFFPQHEEVLKFARARGERALGMLDSHFGGSKFLVGNQPTIADIAVFTWVAVAEEGGYDLSRWPNVQAWAGRMLKLPRAAHPYATMPKENRIAA